MKQPRMVLAKIIAEKTATINDPKVLAREIAAYLIAENRVNDLTLILRDVLVLRKASGLIEADVVSAYELSDEAIAQVKKLVKTTYPHATAITIDHRLSDEPIGGLKVVMPDEQLDLSVRRKLSIFKNAAISGKE